MTKPTVLLLPGMMCDERLFQHQVKNLSQIADVSIGDITQYDSIEQTADSLLRTHGNSELVLAGLSMGAIVAMEMIRQMPDRIQQAAFLNTNPRADTREKRAARRGQMDRVHAGQLERVLIEEMKPNYLAPQSRQNPELLALIRDMGLGLGDDVFIRQSRALAGRQDYRQTLAAYKGPALIISGEYDLLCPTALHLEMAQWLTNSEFKEIKQCGHLSTLEQPLTVSQTLINWLDKHNENFYESKI